jgi:hypothetical protein
LNSGISLCVTIKDKPTQTYNSIPPIILELLNAYSLLEENLGRYPKSAKLDGSAAHSKPQSSPLVNLRLYDKKSYIDMKLEYIIEDIYKSIHFR